MAETNGCVWLNAGEGPAYWVVGDHLTFKIGSEQTSGRYALAETRCVPGGGPPAHTHQNEDETFYVLEGEFEFTFGSETFSGSAGYAIHLPKGIIHQFRLTGSQPGRFLVAATPGGFERFVAECGTPFTGQATPPQPTPEDMQKLFAACAKYGITMNPQWRASRQGPPCQKRKTLHVLDQQVDIKLTGEQTGGAYCMTEVTTRPGSGVSLHRHRDDDEFFYILQGTYEFTLGQERKRLRLGPGSFLNVPRQMYHALSNVGRETARFLDYHTPGGFEKFLLEAAEATPQRTLDLFEKYGSEMAGE